jgi:hypothetical protein
VFCTLFKWPDVRSKMRLLRWYKPADSRAPLARCVAPSSRSRDGGGRAIFWLRRIDTEISSEPKIRDVCATCNNVHLSALDDYVTRLFDRAFIHIPTRYESVLFEYDYHLLKRCLLKLCFNSARVHHARDLFAFEPLRSYMLGKSIDRGKSVQLYVQLAYSAEVPISALKDPADAPVMFTPIDHRIGHRLFEAAVGQKLLRAVHLRAYSFLLAFFKPGEKATVRDDFCQHFLNHHPHAALLRASRKSVELVCDGLSAWENWEGCRETVFSNELT